MRAATALAALAAASWSTAGAVGVQPDGSIVLPTGQTITPAGTHIMVGDRPLGMALSPDGGVLAVVTGSNFAPRQLVVLDVASGRVAQTIGIGDSFVGVGFSPDGGALYVGGGRDDNVKVFHRQPNGQLKQGAAIAIPGAAPSGLAVSPQDGTLYVALNLKHSLAVVNPKTRSVAQIPVGRYPYSAVITPDAAKVYVSNWGGRRPGAGDVSDGVYGLVVDPATGIPSTGTVSVIDTRSRSVLKTIEVGLHPSAMSVSHDGATLYVANAGSDTVSVIDTAADAVTATITVSPFAFAPLGSAPNALALSPDGATLYVANGANNAVAVVDTHDPARGPRGQIPTGWYPAALALSADGGRLFIASSYGFGSLAPSPPGRAGRSFKDRVGVISVVAVPDEAQLAAYTEAVLRNNGAPLASGGTAVPIRTRRLRRPPVPIAPWEVSPIRHVVLIIKENRTYDQLLGDLRQGNGASELALFGQDVTPNQHALAEEFVLLDNFYAAGDQSMQGHQWCDESNANDYAYKYGGARAVSEPMAFATSGFLWTAARRAGKSVRVYGELGSATVNPSTGTWLSIYDDWRDATGLFQIGGTSRVLGLAEISAPAFPGFSLLVPDQVRADAFLRELGTYELLGSFPDLAILALPADHTNGTSPGYPTPRAMVADNDLALGRIVEGITRSSFWPSTAILVAEDDAQDGVDHVDGHRTVGLVISPYARRHAVDSTLYTTLSMVRTVEQILAVPPLSQHDLAAAPMLASFTDTPDLSPYTALPNRIALDEMNPSLTAVHGLQLALARACQAMDFRAPDAAPEDLLNRAVWHSVRGFAQAYPASDVGEVTRDEEDAGKAPHP